MSDPTPKKNGRIDEVPVWMQAVSRETYYNAAADEATVDPQPQENQSDSPRSTRSQQAAEEDDPTVLRRKLSISMGDPSELPSPDPNLQPKPVGHVRADLERRLQQAAAVLETRYTDGFSKGLIIEYSLRRTLIDLHEKDQESALVQWLDSVLPTVQ